MAQIVTITNPLTGQPAQVDQLDHTAQQIDDAIARALPGGGIDTLLAGKAPAGYGLGLSGPPATDDCNTATKNGWYHVHGATLNKPFNKVGALLVVCRASTQIYQLFFVGETYATGGSCIIVRSMYGGEWGPWEWVNPPMQLGVEYRTTERYLGKPVYTKTIDCGAGPNKTDKYVYFDTTTPNIDRVISIEGSNSDGGAFPYERKNDSDYLSAAKDYILIESTYDRSNVTIYATIKYTKTTD